MRYMMPGICCGQGESPTQLFLLPFLFILMIAGTTMADESSGVGVAPVGAGSLPGRLFEDGTVCLGEAKTPSTCGKILFTLPGDVRKKVRTVIGRPFMTPDSHFEDFFKPSSQFPEFGGFFLS